MFRPTAAQLACCLTILTMLCPAAAAETVDGRVSHVTLYRGQAQITRAIPVDGDAGSREIVVGNLPEQVIPNSLFAEGGDAFEIRAVRFRTRAVGEAPREEVRTLEQQIQDVGRQIELTAKRQALLAKRTEYLAKLEGFVAPTAQSDLSKGVLDAEALERLTTFTFQQHEKIAEDEVELARQAVDLNAQLELLNRQLAEITAGASRTVRDAVLFVEKAAAGAAELRLAYLVTNCGWSPSYTMRASADRKQVGVEYNAIIQQLTGEDWTGVTLTLSTASPSLAAAGPGLAPFHVTLSATPEAQQQTGQIANGGFGARLQVMDEFGKLKSQQFEYANAANNAIAFDDRNRVAWSLNEFACAMQQLELNGDAVTVSVLRTESDEAEGPSISYQLPGGVSLASRSDQQMVRILQTDMSSEFYHVAVPVLTSFVYREAELLNGSDEDLLAGPMTVYLDGRFVGQGEIPTVARGQRFVVGFGSDPQLRTRRELVAKKDNLQGGNRETRFEYRLVIENYSGAAMPVRVLDRLPHAENGADVEVTLGKLSDELSADVLYVREERPMGLLRWDVTAAANAAGESARLIEYDYTMEYDRQFVVALPDSKQRQQEEFERLERGGRSGGDERGEERGSRGGESELGFK